MKIRKVINNNIVNASDEDGEEVIVLGNGVGFQKKRGDVLEKKRIEKVFHLSNEKLSQFEQLVKSIPLSSIRTSEKVIAYAKKELNSRMLFCGKSRDIIRKNIRSVRKPWKS